MMSRALVSKDELDARRDQVRLHLRRGLRPRDILALMRDQYEIYRNPYKTLMADIHAVREEDARALQIVQPHEAMGEYVGRLEQLFQQAMVDSLRLQGNARVGALNTARELAKDIARAKGVDRRILGEGKDVTLRPGEGDGGSFEELVLRLRRERGIDEQSG